jgi:hypothetical protein
MTKIIEESNYKCTAIKDQLSDYIAVIYYNNRSIYKKTNWSKRN